VTVDEQKRPKLGSRVGHFKCQYGGEISSENICQKNKKLDFLSPFVLCCVFHSCLVCVLLYLSTGRSAIND
jgi:hypothetical protein